ncbi:MAG: glutamate racemase [Clostridiales bacterium]|nr:glutamate racemase [Clostridiales bacterium]
MQNRPIGVFDSGVGGLTCVKELRKLLPNEDIIYFGDTGRVPYGNRSNQTINKYARQDADFLISKNVKAIIAACGTVSSVATSLGDSLDVFYTGVLEPTAKAAVNATKNGKIAVIGTTATIKSGSYEREIMSIDPEIKIITQDCPLFVPLVENGFVDKNNRITRLTVKHYLKNIRLSGADTLILGCTHYPIIKHIIKDYMGDNVTLIDSGCATAEYCAEHLAKNDMLNNKASKGSTEFYVSDTTEGFSMLAGLFLNEKVSNNVYHIDIGALAAKK